MYPAVQGVVGVDAVCGVERIVVLLAEELICSVASHQRVIAGASAQGVAGRATYKLVGSLLAV
jgi:hypothetical protein